MDLCKPHCPERSDRVKAEEAKSKGKYTEQFLHMLPVLRLREYPPLRTVMNKFKE